MKKCCLFLQTISAIHLPTFINTDSGQKKAVDESRAKVADLISAKPEEIIFTFTGSEANNLALRGLALANKDRGKHIIISEIEHFSILYTARELEKEGFKVSYIKVNKDGLVNPADVAKAINKETFLVSIMHANNEIGVIELYKKLERLRKKRILYSIRMQLQLQESFR